MYVQYSVVPQISKEGVTVELVNVVALNVVEVKYCSDTLGLPRNNYYFAFAQHKELCLEWCSNYLQKYEEGVNVSAPPLIRTLKMVLLIDLGENCVTLPVAF